ncbi:MAG TPA: hypothetical protein PLI09_07060 [Candidatus Hydrogenedentes bacterium]|nr:hypothetical protein [Candidatus Hydrogenedentota bacterium]
MPMPREMLPESPKEWVLFIIYRLIVGVVIATVVYFLLFYYVLVNPTAGPWWLRVGIYIVLVVICMIVPFYVMDILGWPDRNSKD